MIVALARKLLVALWKYTTAGVVPEGAVHQGRLNRRRPHPHPAGTLRSRPVQANEPPSSLDLYAPQLRLVSFSRSPLPPNAEAWCSRPERRPNVRLDGRDNAAPNAGLRPAIRKTGHPTVPQ